MKTFIKISPLLAFTLLLTACSQEPATINYGSDECMHCKMMITDNRFAAQIVIETGKAIKFDSIECMAEYAGSHKSELKDARFWVSDFSSPGSWLDVQQANIIKSEVINSPMGASLLAIGNDEAADEHLSEFPGEQVQWERLVR